MQFGRTYEEFEVGAVYKHWPGKTVTEAEDHLFCLITMNHHPLHIDAHYATGSTQFGRNVVVGNLIYSLLLGMSVPDVSGKAIANLEIESLRHVAPTFHGDTIYGETTVHRSAQVRPRRPRDRPGRTRVQAGQHLSARSGARSWCRRNCLNARGGDQPGRLRLRTPISGRDVLGGEAGPGEGCEDPR